MKRESRENRGLCPQL